MGKMKAVQSTTTLMRQIFIIDCADVTGITSNKYYEQWRGTGEGRENEWVEGKGSCGLRVMQQLDSRGVR